LKYPLIWGKKKSCYFVVINVLNIPCSNGIPTLFFSFFLITDRSIPKELGNGSIIYAE